MNTRRGLKILLSSPPFQYFNTSHWLLPNFPAITLAQLAGGLDPRHEVRILDNSHHKLRGHILWPTLDDFEPDIVGFTCMYAPDAPVLWDVARQIKERYPGTKIFAGGSVATHVAELFVHNGFDGVLKDEGDFAIEEIADAIEQGGDDWSHIDGLIWRDRHGGVVENRARALIEDLDRVPFPRRDLLATYPALSYEGGKGTSLETTRGCPYKCNFCTRPTFLQSYRHFSNERVLEDMERVRHEGFLEIIFTDDMFAANVPKAMELAEEMIRRQFGFRLGAAMRADTICKHPELIRLLARAGFILVHVGFETYRQKMMDDLGKNISAEKNIQASSILRENGMFVLASHIFGAKDQNPEMAWDMVRHGIENTSIFRMGILTPHVGSALYQQMVDDGTLLKDDLKSQSYFEYLIDDGRDPKQMQRAFVMTLLAYYFHPRILNATLRDPSKVRRKVLRNAYKGNVFFVLGRTLDRLGVNLAS